ncbi:MAG TPA: substrate-binding domain-containing protein [Acidimicrobiales bacterium]|nr:substrate-binding domain-containing protein [Acidimicrobiales bacterium]
MLIALPVLSGSCATSGTEYPAGPPAGESEGSVWVSGSSTVAPISAFVADEFNYNGSPASITVDDPGTGDGFALFCDGVIEVAGASRPVKAEELEQCAANGIEPIELEVALDGITVLTSAANDDVTCLAFADLYALLGPEAEGVERWSEASELAAELGSTTELPDAALEVTAPGTESGTYDAFVELVVADLAEARVEEGELDADQAESLREDYSSQADDNSIIAGIEGSHHSLGFVGFAFAEGAGDGVRELAVDGGDGCVSPSVDTIADATYPIARSLYIYVSADAAADDPAVREYVDYFLLDISLQDLVAEAGYVPLPAERIEDTRQRWASRTTGSDHATATVTA